jgi:hypothetical protein
METTGSSYQPVSAEFDPAKHLLCVDKDTKQVYMTERGMIDRWSFGRKILSALTSKNYDLVAVHDALMEKNKELARTHIFPQLRDRIITYVEKDKKDPKKAAQLLQAIFLRMPAISITSNGSYIADNSSVVPVTIQEAMRKPILDLALKFASAGYTGSVTKEFQSKNKTCFLSYSDGRFTIQYNEPSRSDNPQRITIQLFKDSSTAHVYISPPPAMQPKEALDLLADGGKALSTQDFHQ